MKGFRKWDGVGGFRWGWDFPTLGALGIVVVFAIVMATGGVLDPEGELRDLFPGLGLSWNGVRSGAVWGFLTHPLLHGSWVHVGLNAILLFYAGGRVNYLIGRRVAWKGFVLGVVVAGVIQVIFQALFPVLPQGPLVGASGGVMALLLALVTLAPDSRMLLPVSGQNMGRGVLLAALLLFLMTPELGLPVFGWVGKLAVDAGLGAVFMIGHLYHLAGGLVGWWWGTKLLGKPVTLEQLRRERESLEG